MLALAISLSAVMGVALGLLGGGGSILTVPILVYALGFEAKNAIATSLLVVGITSFVAMIQHARSGHVQWRTGLLFGGVAMVGAYFGGFAAHFLSGTTLLVLFAVLMLVTAIAMLRRREPEVEDHTRTASHAWWKIGLEGLVVGAITGLVGAGGGFLVVPALVLLGGLNMRDAIGTSLLVIGLKSSAGLAGHLTHVSLDLGIAAWIIASAVSGSFLGAALAKQVSAAKLRTGFAVFVLLAAVSMLHAELTSELQAALFNERWPFWVGGAIIGGFVLVFRRYAGQALGVSTGFSDACVAAHDTRARRSWRLPFLVGIALGGLIAALLAGGWAPSFVMGSFDEIISASLVIKALVFGFGGILLGFGARLAGGCTSGHGIVGTALLAPSSLMATAAFMLSGFAATRIVLAWWA